MEYFKEGFGLITKSDPWTENCNLFYAEWLTLKGQADQKDVDFFTTNMHLKLNKDGLYNRRSIENSPPRSMSKDEILGFLVTSKRLNTYHGEEIWYHLVHNFGSYNNTETLLDYLPFNPANFYEWGQLVGSKLSYLFLIFYVPSLFIACLTGKQNTTSKIRYWLAFENMPKTKLNKLFCKLFELRMKFQYGKDYTKGLFDIYFKDEDKQEFPIFIELYK